MTILTKVITYSQHRPTGFEVIGTVHVPSMLTGYINIRIKFKIFWWFKANISYAVQVL